MAAKTNLLTLFFTSLFFCYIHLFSPSLIEATRNGFSIDLIHRDSPLSPLYNSTSSHFDRLKSAFHRSVSRCSRFNYGPNSIESNVIGGTGEYLMEVSIGTPPVKMLAIADTGSDITWVQCKPCVQCYKQTSPLFDPESSSTYTTVSCQSQRCADVGNAQCSNDNTCGYRVDYGDRSYTIGDVAVDTFTFDSTTSPQPVSIPGVAFGCGHENDGTFQETGAGLVGLGGDSISIINQLSRIIGGKFSYCLVAIYDTSGATSKLIFGADALVSGPGVVSTPLVSKDPATFYYVTLEGLSVGSRRLEYKTKRFGTEAEVETGNIILDSGTTLTFLPTDFYQDLESSLRDAITAEPIDDPQGFFGLCYRTEDRIRVPVITAHFTGADLKLYPLSTFLEVEEGITCFTMVPNGGSLSIFGNLSQMNFLVGYDLVNQQVSFKPTNCARQ